MQNEEIVDENHNVIIPARDMDVLMFCINVGGGGTESGLGISIKGKSATTGHGNRDLGLFIKSINQGYAAAKVTIFFT